MTNKSMEGLKTSVLASMGDEEAKQRIEAQRQGFNMMNPQQNINNQTSKSIDQLALDREVEVGLGKSIGRDMSDLEKQSYIDSLSDAEYRQMKIYKNQGYSFEAAKTLLENSDSLDNPTAKGTEKYVPKGNWFRNIVGGAGDSATGIGQFLGNGAADIIGWTAKKLGADEEKVDYLVEDFKNYLEDNKISKTVGANTNSALYKGTKIATDLAQTAGLGGVGKDIVKGALGGYPLVTKATPLGVRMGVGAIEGMADMGIYSVVSDSELPSKGELTLGGVLGAAFPLGGAIIKAGKNTAKKGAVKAAEDLVSTLNKLPQGKQKEFFKMAGEKASKWMNDRGIKDGEGLIDYFTRSKSKVDEALDAIQGNFKSKEVDDVLKDAIKFARKTKDPQLNRLIELINKHGAEGLTMKEINEVKRWFERNNKFTYLNKGTGEQAKRATNLDTALRNWQKKTAADNGFSNLSELNKETQAAKYLLNNTFDVAEMGSKNPMEFTDWIVAAGSLDGKWLSNLVKKQMVESPWFRRYAIDILNKIGGKKTIEEAMADLDAIAKMNDKKMVEKYLTSKGYNDVPKLELKDGVEDVKTTILPSETIITAPSGESVVKQEITELPRY